MNRPQDFAVRDGAAAAESNPASKNGWKDWKKELCGSQRTATGVECPKSEKDIITIQTIKEEDRPANIEPARNKRRRPPAAELKYGKLTDLH